MTEAIGTTAAATPEIVELREQRAAVVRIEGRADELPRLLGEAYGLTQEAIGQSGATIAGPPFARWLAFGERMTAEIGFPFTGELTPTDRVREALLPGGRAVTTTHVGPYEGIGAAWDRAVAWMKERELHATGPGWEAYLTGPEDPGPPVTRLYWPIA
jgi:effector-binding domain-containing protein